MALSMIIRSCRPLRVNAINCCKFYGEIGELHISSVSRTLRCQETRGRRYVPCSYFSQQADKSQTSAPTKPGLLMRVLHKTDDVFCNILGRISPWMLQEYGLFKIGFVQFTADAKSVYYINKRIRKENLQLKDLHWKELYLKKQISNDMAKMTPTVLALCLPIVYYFVLPLMFLYPTVFLSNQFLSREKLLRYYLKSYQKRAALYPAVLELLSQRIGDIQGEDSQDLLKALIKRLRSEQQVPSEQVLLTQDAFKTLSFKRLPRAHLKCLCNLCSLRTMFMPGFLLRRKLAKNVALIQAMDHSIHQDGVSTLDELQLEKLCYERGLNVVHSDKDEMQAWLGQWLQVSARTDDDDRSFIAHCVALLVIGHPTCSRLEDIASPAANTAEESPRDQ